MKPSDKFAKMFKRLTAKQAQTVLADLIISQNNDEHYDLWNDSNWASDPSHDDDDLIVMALKIALDQVYTSDKSDVLDVIMESIAEDEEYFNYGQCDPPKDVPPLAEEGIQYIQRHNAERGVEMTPDEIRRMLNEAVDGFEDEKEEKV